MGRSTSHITLEVALMSLPTWAIVSEEIKEKKLTLVQVTSHIADMVESRSKKGFNFSVVLIPEGLLVFFPEMGVLISELNDLLAKNCAEYAKLTDFKSQSEYVVSQ